MPRVERRRAERRAPAPGDPVARIRLRTGREFSVLNIASRGALLEGSALRPGSHIDMTLTTAAGRVLVRAYVARCCVARLTASVVVYQAAVAFEQAVAVAAGGYAIPMQVGEAAAPPGKPYPAAEPVVGLTLPETLTA
jgi:hypothetical protein